MSSSDEPGSSSQQSGRLPVAKQALAQKRNVRDLNTRLEMYVRAQAEKTRTVNSLKEALARQEMEYRNKIKQQTVQYMDTIEKLRKENESLIYDNKCKDNELVSSMSTKKEFEERLIGSESKNATLTSEVDALSVEIERYKKEMDIVRGQYASIKYKYESYEKERNSFSENAAKQKLKNEQLLRELTQKEGELKTDRETFQRVIIEKNDEIDKYRQEIKDLNVSFGSTQNRLRKEFDNKLAEFVQKREEQYKQEKDEWMRIFKEEFNRKLRSFKEANQELSHSNVKQSEEITDLRARISKLKQQKTELEVENRNNEEETDKLRNDLDDLRRTKDQEIKMKNTLILQERDRYKAKELQFDELAGIKLQLDSEIELYRNILNEAEQEIGYKSPLDAKYHSNSNTNNGNRLSRKRKRYNTNNITPMGPLKNNTNTNNRQSIEKKQIKTPGLARAAQNAQKDLKSFNGSDIENDEEMKDREECECNDNDDDNVSYGSFETPGNIEGASLQFSGLNLNRGMIEIQNMGETAIKLDGYILSNQTGTAQHELPKDMILNNKEKLRIYVGEQIYESLCDETNKHNADILGSYTGAYVCWGRDVWTGTDNDCARLYNPKQKEVARIEISPDMVDKSQTKNGCLLM